MQSRRGFANRRLSSGDAQRRGGWPRIRPMTVACAAMALLVGVFCGGPAASGAVLQHAALASAPGSALAFAPSSALASVSAPASAPAPAPAPAPASGLRLELNLAALALRVTYDGQVVASLQAAIGTPRTPTPVCSARVISKVVNPTWHPTDGRPPVPPGPANPLGKYWIGLSRRNYGFHGTNNAASIGRAISGGCVRFGDADIEYLYRIVTIGTPVEIVYRRVEVVSWFGRPVALVHRDVYGRDPLTPADLASRLAALGFAPLPSEAECAGLLVSAKMATAWWPADPARFVAPPAAARAGSPYGLLYFGGGSAGGPLLPGQAEVVLQGVPSRPAAGWLQDGDLWVPAEWLAAALGRRVHVAGQHGWAFFTWPELCLDVPARCREIGGVYHVPLVEVVDVFLCRVVTGDVRWELRLAP